MASWLLSLALPAVAVRGGPALDGLDMLRQGWGALSSGVPSWYANPVFLLACAAALAGRAKLAGVLAGVALLLALTSFAAPELAAAGGRNLVAVAWQVGFYVWLAAHAGLLLAAWSMAAAHLRDAAEKNLPRPGSFRD